MTWRLIVLSLLVFLLWFCKTDASHFRGGTITWKPISPYSREITINFRLAFRSSYSSSYHCDEDTITDGFLIGSGDSWNAQCNDTQYYSYQCNSHSIADTGFYCTEYSVSEDWSMGEKNFTYYFPSDSNIWLVSYTSCCWIYLSGGGSSSWMLSAIVNLNPRYDTGEINSSPVTTNPAIIRVRQGCAQSTRIPLEDPDGDTVRCRWSTYQESLRGSDSFPHGALDEANCILRYNGGGYVDDIYAVALTLEDFPAGTTDFRSSSPFSSIGLQFLVIITSRFGSCSNRPVFTGSTPQDGECSQVQIGSFYKAVIEVESLDPSRHIVEIMTSSPLGMHISPLSYGGGVYYGNITWYPVQYQIGKHVLCFKAMDSSGVESEQRCVTILVGLQLYPPSVILESRQPKNPSSGLQKGPGFMWWSIQFDLAIKKPRQPSYIRLVLSPSGQLIYQVNTSSSLVTIGDNQTVLYFAMPFAALSMAGSYAILIDSGAVVGLDCFYDGAPTPGITSTNQWAFSVPGFCNTGYYLGGPEFQICTDVDECGASHRMKRYIWWNPYVYTSSSTLTSLSSAVSSFTSSSALSPTPPSSYVYATASSSVSSPCHYNLTAWDGYFSSPNHPSNYNNNHYCSWLISVYRYAYVELTFYSFDLEHGGNHCSFDYVEIFDGNSTSAPRIIKRCGSHSQWCVHSSGNSLLVRFRTDGSVTSVGFYAFYKTVWYKSGNCHSATSSISPTLSSSYVHATASSFVPWECKNYIPLTEANRHVSYDSRFGSTYCDSYISYGWYRFTGSAGTQMPESCAGAPEYGCGTHAAGWLTGAHPTVADGSVTYKVCYHWISLCCWQSNYIQVRNCSGYYVYNLGPTPNCDYRYCGTFGNDSYPGISSASAVSPTASSSYVHVTASSSVSGPCHYNLTAWNGYFSSPNYPSNYSNNHYCTWLISVYRYYYVELTFYSFDLERGGNHCPYDYVEIFDGNSTSAPRIIKRCGSHPAWCVHSSGNSLLVRFIANYIVTNPGFSAYYETVWYKSRNCHSATSYIMSATSSAVSPTASSSYVHVTVSSSASGPCHYNLTAWNGNFSSPNYPSNYNNNHYCTWLISVYRYYYVELTFSSFHLEDGGNHCPYDYVEIFDGNSTSAPRIIKRCGSHPAWCVHSSGNSLLVRFIADYIVTNPGFSAYYKTVWYKSRNCHSATSYIMSATSSEFVISPTISSSSPAYVSSSISVPPLLNDFELHLPADCSHFCTNTPGSFTCSCKDGFQLQSDGKTCQDINECLTNNGGCSHNCVNDWGSFYCTCEEGAIMAADNRTCLEQGVGVVCGDDNMTVALEKIAFSVSNARQVHLLNPSCTAQDNGTHFILSTSFNGCGTTRNETNDSLIFLNEVFIASAVNIRNLNITRSHNFRLPFKCQYSRKTLVTLSFVPKRRILVREETGFGILTFTIDFYRTKFFTTPYSDDNYPISVDLNDNLYVMYSVESSTADIVVKAEKCFAARGTSADSSPLYIFIENGCPLDDTMEYHYNASSDRQKFRIQAFRFYNDYNIVYIHCELVACHGSSSDSSCSQQCPVSSRRKKRELEQPAQEYQDTTSRYDVTAGPLIINNNGEQEAEEGNSGASGENGKQAALIGGVAAAGGFALIAVIALSVLFVKYRIARLFMNRNKVEAQYTSQEDDDRKRSYAFVSEEDMIGKDDVI